MSLSRGDRAVLAAVADDAALAARAVAWCAVNTGSRNLAGLAALAPVLAGALAELPGDVVQIDLPETEEVGADGGVRMVANGRALRLRVRPDAPVQVALTGHYDTVYPATSPFRTVASREDGALNGPGIADMKGGIAVLLAALAAFERHPAAADVGYTVLLSPDEETGSLASAALLAGLGAQAHVGLTYEPALADGALASARKGSGNFHLRVTGRAAHAGRDFAAGRNALAAAARVAVALHALNGMREGVTVNVARIDGGGPLNMVPDAAVLRFNVRLPDAAAERWLAGALDEALAEGRGEGLALTLHGGVTRPAKPFGPTQAALFAQARDAGRDLGLSLHWGPSGGVCEGNNLHAAGLPGIDTLGVRGGDIHSTREWAAPDSFAERARLSALLLARVADGTLDAPGLKRRLAAERAEAAAPAT